MGSIVQALNFKRGALLPSENRVMYGFPDRNDVRLEGAEMTTVSEVQTKKATRPRILLWIGLAGLAVFVIFAASVAANPTSPFTQGMDDAWRRLIGASSVDAAEGPFPMFFQHFGQIPGAVLTLILIPAWLFIIRRWRSAVFFLTAEIVGNFGVSQLTKNLVDRPRPADDIAAGLFGPLFQVDHGSLPSGHSVSAGILLIAVAAILPASKRFGWWIVGTFLVLGMIWQRTYINAHWFSDAIIGVVGGASATLVLWWAFSTLLQKDYGKPLFARTPNPVEAS